MGKLSVKITTYIEKIYIEDIAQLYNKISNNKIFPLFKVKKY